MYIEKVRLQEIKCFQDITLHFQSASQTGDVQSNWNVILGNNGDGKTTLLQAIAGCLMDATTAERMLKLQNWVRNRQKEEAAPQFLATATILEPTPDYRALFGHDLGAVTVAERCQSGSFKITD